MPSGSSSTTNHVDGVLNFGNPCRFRAASAAATASGSDATTMSRCNRFFSVRRSGTTCKKQVWSRPPIDEVRVAVLAPSRDSPALLSQNAFITERSFTSSPTSTITGGRDDAVDAAVCSCVIVLGFERARRPFVRLVISVTSATAEARSPVIPLMLAVADASRRRGLVHDGTSGPKEMWKPRLGRSAADRRRAVLPRRTGEQRLEQLRCPCS